MRFVRRELLRRKTLLRNSLKYHPTTRTQTSFFPFFNLHKNVPSKEPVATGNRYVEEHCLGAGASAPFFYLSEDPANGSLRNIYQRKTRSGMWTRMQRIRTLSSIPFEFPVITEPSFKYQKIADEAQKLRKLGMRYRAIGRALGVDYKVVIRALSPC